jgi:HME family heavy-metal exporter/cobalt-zinc-cadmium resistance protein CzcA
MFMFTVDGDTYSLAERRRVLDWVIRPALRTVAGVADVNALGGVVRGYEVIPDPARLRARGVTLDQLRQALEANNRNDGAGRLDRGEEHWVVRVEGGVRGLDDLRAVVIVPARNGQVAATVGDVATVRLGEATRNGAVSRDGHGEAVQGLVLGLRGVDARSLVDAVQARLDELVPRLPKGMSIQVFYNRGELVSRAAGTVVRALVEASVLVVVILYLFLGGVRAALVVAATLPLSMLATFLLMRYVGLTANLMSLGGLAIALGMLVDASVVVVENIETALAHSQEDASSAKSVDRFGLIRDAVSAVSAPMLAGVSIIAIVFLPLLTLQGLEGKLFAPVALTIVLALGASVLIAFTVVPALASLLLRSHASDAPWLMRKLAGSFAWMQAWSLAHRRAVFGIAVATLAGAAALYLSVGKTFMPTMDEGDLIVQLQKAPSISLPASLDMDQRVQQALLKGVRKSAPS